MKTFFFSLVATNKLYCRKMESSYKKAIYIYGANLIIIYSKAEEFESKYVLY